MEDGKQLQVDPFALAREVVFLTDADARRQGLSALPNAMVVLQVAVRTDCKWNFIHWELY